MNEELQSANEQLETMNEQLVRQSGDIERADDFLYATIDGLDVAIAVLDGRFDVVAWNLTATDMFGVAAEVASARSILTLGIGLPVAELAPILQRAVDAEPGTSEQVTLDGTDRSGRSVRWDVTVKTLRSGDDAALLLMIAQGGGGG